MTDAERRNQQIIWAEVLCQDVGAVVEPRPSGFDMVFPSTMDKAEAESIFIQICLNVRAMYET